MDYSILINEFSRPQSKIDYIKLRIPKDIENDVSAASPFEEELLKYGGYIKTPQKYREIEGLHFTIHDPSLQAIQFLINEHPDTEILSLEIAMDFKLKDGSNDPIRLVALHSWLKESLFPQRHKRMIEAKRKFYDISDKSIKRDTLRTKSGNETVYWQDASLIEQVRLYIKTRDNGKAVKEYSVRLEITLSQSACIRAKVDRTWMIPQFAQGMRRYLSPFFNVAKGIKPPIKRSRATTPLKQKLAELQAEKERKRAERNWRKYGAAWAAEHGYKIIPDADTNRWIGDGLKGLQNKMKRLKMTRKVDECIDHWAGITFLNR